MLRIIHKHRECIGCDLCCEVAPGYWYMNDEGLAELRYVLRVIDNLQFGEGWNEDAETLRRAEKSCPVNIIRIEG